MSDLRINHVAEKTEAYVHRAKSMMLDLFGQEAAHDQPVVTLQLVAAMIQLEAAETMAEANRQLTEALLRMKE